MISYFGNTFVCDANFFYYTAISAVSLYYKAYFEKPLKSTAASKQDS